jgi:hypothetical protein
MRLGTRLCFELRLAIEARDQNSDESSSGHRSNPCLWYSGNWGNICGPRDLSVVRCAPNQTEEKSVPLRGVRTRPGCNA